MNLTFVEVTEFTNVVQHYFGGDEGLRVFQNALLEQPERGDVMMGCGGLRKARWPDPRRGKWTRGGLRIIYLHVPEAQHVLLLDVYDKDESSDLTSKQRAALATLAAQLRKEIIRTYQGRKQG